MSFVDASEIEAVTAAAVSQSPAGLAGSLYSQSSPRVRDAVTSAASRVFVQAYGRPSGDALQPGASPTHVRAAAVRLARTSRLQAAKYLQAQPGLVVSNVFLVWLLPLLLRAAFSALLNWWLSADNAQEKVKALLVAGYANDLPAAQDD